MAIRLRYRNRGKFGVAAAGNNDKVFLAYVDFYNNIIIISSENGWEWSRPTTIREKTIDKPALCSFNRNLYLAWAGYTSDPNDHNIHVMSFGNNGTSYGTRKTLPYRSNFGPALTDFKMPVSGSSREWRLWLAWTAPDGHIFSSKDPFKKMSTATILLLSQGYF